MVAKRQIRTVILPYTRINRCNDNWWITRYRSELVQGKLTDNLVS